MTEDTNVDAVVADTAVVADETVEETPAVEAEEVAPVAEEIVADEAPEAEVAA